MIVKLKKSIPYVIRSILETTLSGEWLLECLQSLVNCGFFIRAVCTDNHASNVNAIKRLLKEHSVTNKFSAIAYPDNNSSPTYLFFDSVHLLKNIRNNLFSNKKFVFPKFQFKYRNIEINCPHGYISWSDIRSIYDRDLDADANLRKALNFLTKCYTLEIINRT